jgi:hypothetical protein
MNFDRLLFYLLATIIFISTAVMFARSFNQKRTKYNLVATIVSLLLIAITILSYFFPWKRLHGINVGIQIAILVALVIVLWIFLFYYEIQNFIRKQINKNKLS